MTANDSKSTPKKAEDATRHPLALLADGWEARARLLTENARTEQSEQSARYYAARAAEAQDCAAQLREALRAQAEADTLQARAVAWVREAFGSEPADCKTERAHRFLEEALEAGQAADVTEDEALQLVQYVYGRDKGEIAQEVGGVLLTLAPFAAAFGVNMMDAAEAELARVNTPEIIEKCRRKNASKPRNSPLPGSDTLAQAQAGAGSEGGEAQ